MDEKDRVIQLMNRELDATKGILSEMQRENSYIDSVIDKAIANNGRFLQSVVAMEEMAELQKELSKALRGMYTTGEYDTSGMLEEVADVRIMLRQIMKMYDIDEKAVKAVMHSKIVRLDERL